MSSTPTRSGSLPGSAQETRGRILDAAENLFGDHGFSNVSLRQITTHAEVNLAAVNYHFGSKDALVFEVMSRVVGPINQERLRLLDTVEAEAGKKPPAVEQILDALFRPVISQMQRTDHNSAVFLKLAGRCMSEQEIQFPDTLLRVFREVADRFVSAVRKSLPQLGERDVFWRLHFSIGVILYTLTQDDRLKLFSGGKVSASDPEETLAQLIAYTAAGLAADSISKKPTPSRTKSVALKAGLIGIGCLLGIGCAARSPENAREHAELGDVPEDYQAASGSTEAKGVIADRNWIQDFGDSRLNELIEEAIEKNRDLKAAAARIEIAQANARISGANLRPQADGNFRGSRQKRNFIGFPFGGGDAGAGGGAAGGGAAPDSVFSNLNNEFGLSLDLSWEIDLWGRIRAGQSAALAEAEAATAERAAAELSIAAQTAKAWFALLEARAQVDLANDTVEVFQGTEKAIRDRFEAGIEERGAGLASQLRLAMVDVETARESVEQQTELANRTARQIEVLLGRYPAGVLKATRDLPGIPGTPPAGMPGDLLDRRPDLQASERRLAAADQRLVEAKRALLPGISLSGSYGTSSEQIEDLLNQNFNIWSLAGNAAQPILRGGALREGIRLRKSEIKLAAADFEQTALTAFGEVENALDNEGYLARREASLEKAKQLADEAYRTAESEFQNGTGDVLTMLEAQRRKVSQESQLISIRRLRLDNRIDLHLALGGDFKTPES